MKSNQKGFALVGLLIVVAIIALMFVWYYRKDDGSKSSPRQQGQEAIEQTKRNNQTQLEQQIEIQNQINSIE